MGLLKSFRNQGINYFEQRSYSYPFYLHRFPLDGVRETNPVEVIEDEVSVVVPKGSFLCNAI